MPNVSFHHSLHHTFFRFFSIRKRGESTLHNVDHLSIIELEGQQDLISDEFGSDHEHIDRNDHLSHWLADDDLKNSETETLPAAEEQFWLDLIRRYLEPIEPTDEEKVVDDHEFSLSPCRWLIWSKTFSLLAHLLL